MPTLLLYHLEKNEMELVQELCKKVNVQTREVGEADFLQPVGSLAGIDGIEANAPSFGGAAFGDKMLVFFRFSDAALFDFLKRWREAGIEPVDLKAVITPINAYWTSLQLHDALVSERNQLAQGSHAPA